MGIMKTLLVLLVILVIVVVAGFFALKTYFLPKIVNQYVNSSQVQNSVGALQVMHFEDANPFANTSSGTPAPP